MMRRLLLPLFCVSCLWLASCSNQRYETVPKDRIFGGWGVTNDTRTFGMTDSLYYLITPVRNVHDSIYFNGNYTDSYYDADSTRVTLRFTTSDSIIFAIERRYAVQVNPRHLVMTLECRRDTVTDTCTLRLARDASNGDIFSCGPDSLFTAMLAKGGEIHGRATNAGSQGEPQGSQNYEFLLEADGFRKAMLLADSLNVRIRKDVHLLHHSTVHHSIFSFLTPP